MRCAMNRGGTIGVGKFEDRNSAARFKSADITITSLWRFNCARRIDAACYAALVKLATGSSRTIQCRTRYVNGIGLGVAAIISQSADIQRRTRNIGETVTARV